MRSKLNFVYHYQASKGQSTVREGSADPRDKILELIMTVPVVQDRFYFNSPNNGVVNEVLICNSFITNPSVRMFRKTTSLSRFEIFRNLCPSCTVATIPTKHHAFSCHFPSYFFFLHAPRSKILQFMFNADLFLECPLAACHLTF